MLDNQLLNQGLLGNSGDGGISGGGGEDTGYGFVFNGYKLDNGTTRRVIKSTHDDLGSVAYETYNYSRSDGGNALSKYYRTKTITITISVSASTPEELNDLIDEIKYETSQMQGYLDITINGIVRRREATLTSLNFNRNSYNVDWLGNVVLTFNCVNPLAFSLSSINKTYSNISGTFTTEIQYNGKVNCYPTIYFILNSVNTLEELTIDMNGYLFSTSGSFNAGDIIEIDGETKLVKLNGNIITYDGPFPLLQPGLNHIQTALNTGAIANYNMIFIYKDLYL